MFKVKLRKSDILFSKYIRTRDGWRCVACDLDTETGSKDYSEHKQGLHCSHYWGRGRENTRFDPENCLALCLYHHKYSAGWGHTETKPRFTAYLREKLGDKGFDLLEVRAYTYKKRDDLLDEIIVKELLKELE
jgi:hypothetical protein